jgi:hypothetical protein
MIIRDDMFATVYHQSQAAALLFYCMRTFYMS